jgi:hypothetical protein
MQRANAYMALAAELEMWSRRPSSELFACVGLPATSRVVEVQGEELQLELTVSWTNEKRRAIRIAGMAIGPSHWRLERLDESVVVDFPL